MKFVNASFLQKIHSRPWLELSKCNKYALTYCTYLVGTKRKFPTGNYSRYNDFKKTKQKNLNLLYDIKILNSNYL